ncbi:MAG TPA: transglycosylase SLT domain-containing protein [Longimicrobium sp.]|nr:transglycosylase SLT domain-containing protein [Longimicrobium sp.]
MTERRRRSPASRAGAVAGRLQFRGLPMLGGAAALIAGGAALAMFGTSDVTRAFAPPAGPPDTLTHIGAPLPRTPRIVEGRYLRRALAAETGIDRAVGEFAARYNITQTFARTIYQAAVAQRVDPELAFRLIRVESVFDPEARNPGGALGLCQLMPGTARDIDPKVGSDAAIMEPATNMRLGFTNLRNMIELFKGDVRLGVIAYNRGEVAVQRAVRKGKDPENGYSEHVLGPRHHGGQRYAGKGLLPAPEQVAADTAGIRD